MIFYDIVTDPLACLKLLKLFKYLLLLSWGMTGKSGRRLGYLPIPCVVQLYDFWKENNVLDTSIHEYCGWFMSGKICLIDWHCMNSVDGTYNAVHTGRKDGRLHGTRPCTGRVHGRDRVTDGPCAWPVHGRVHSLYTAVGGRVHGPKTRPCTEYPTV